MVSPEYVGPSPEKFWPQESSSLSCGFVQRDGSIRPIRSPWESKFNWKSISLVNRAESIINFNTEHHQPQFDFSAGGWGMLLQGKTKQHFSKDMIIFHLAAYGGLCWPEEPGVERLEAVRCCCQRSAWKVAGTKMYIYYLLHCYDLLSDIFLDQECPFHVLETWLLVNTTMEENIRKGTSRLSCSGSIVCQDIFPIKCCAQICAIYLLAGFLQAMELHKLSTKMDKKVEQMNFKVFVPTRPKPRLNRWVKIQFWSSQCPALRLWRSSWLN